jgi:general secretion pathway protein E
LAKDDWQALTRPWQAPLPSQAHQAIGCTECRDTGFRGRAGVYEIMQMTDTVKAHIQAETDLLSLKRRAVMEGMRSLRLSGAQKIAAGQTTLEEVLRVTPRNDLK